MSKQAENATTPGERLRAARSATGWSLTELSQRTGGRLSKSRISNYELGLRRLPIEGAESLAEALGTVSAAHLLCLDDDCAADPAEAELLHTYRALDPTQRQEVLAGAKHRLGK